MHYIIRKKPGCPIMIGLRILEMRQKIGWSQSRLARELGVSVKSIKNWENEVSDPSVGNIVHLAKLFSVTADYLLGIDTQSTIVISSLSRQDQNCLRGICQLYISNALNHDHP